MTTAIIDLMGLKFNIPDYQRGYRWEEQEVTELLDDLWDFNNSNDSGDFYCLQPIVLKKNEDDSFDVLDGQQRLTTLYILLVYLEDMRKSPEYDKSLFTLNYSTRTDCEIFLKEKKFINGEIDDSNIDYYHIGKAYQAIDKWFKKEEHKSAKREMLFILLDETVRDDNRKKKNNVGVIKYIVEDSENSKDVSIRLNIDEIALLFNEAVKDENRKKNRNVRVIKYIVEDTENPIDVFIRLNIGKIPLTDAELTKALLLQADKYSSSELKYNRMKLHNIATEWDNIETELQKENFWGFIGDQTIKDKTHIEFIFNIIADKLQEKYKYFEEKPKKYSTFLIFSKYLEDLMRAKKDGSLLTRIEAVEKIWGEVVEYFEYFKEWYNDTTLYHNIGFLLNHRSYKSYSKYIGNLVEKSKTLSKTQFVEYVEDLIGNVIELSKGINELHYNNDTTPIHRLLLIHNVFSTMKSDKENARFPFNLYKEEKKWSLEHIHAQNSENIKDREKQNTWIDDHVRSFSNSDDDDIKAIVEKLISMRKAKKIEQTVFDAIVADIDMIMDDKNGLSGDEIHKLENLCLLDSSTNSHLNNSVFEVKREKIKTRSRDGFYIPLCTRNAFLKAYTEYPQDNIYWKEEDRKGYLKSIQDVYNHFVKPEKQS